MRGLINFIFVCVFTSAILSCGGGSSDGSGSSDLTNNTITGSISPIDSSSKSCASSLVSSSVSPASSPAVLWGEYSSQISQLQTEYVGLPTTINISPIWFNSLNVKPENFSTRIDSFSINGPLEYGVGYGSYALHDNKKYVFYSDWAVENPNNGSAFAIEYLNDTPSCVDYLAIEGSTLSWVLKNQNGSQSVVFMGVDEGKLVDPYAQPTSPTYFYDLDSKSWSYSSYLTASHNSVPFDYDNDGDEDIVAQTWREPFGGSPFIMENNNGDFTLLKRLGNFNSGMAVAPLGFQANGNFELLITDADSLPQYNIGVETNYIVNISSDLTSVIDAYAVPIPYFEAPIFEDVTQVSPEWEGGVGLSHDVAAKSLDLDYDGDLDIIVSSVIWSDYQPYAVLQFLINENGTYVDDTENRLFNWLLIGPGQHRLDFIDVNGDGHLDILTSDHGTAFCCKHNLPVASGSRVLVNDGTGHFLNVIHQQINEDGHFQPTSIPSLNAANHLSWTVIEPQNAGTSVQVTTRSLNMELSTGPNMTDPATLGAPNFNEFYYLLHNPDVRTAINNSQFATGLEHYLAVGQSEGRQTFVPFD